MVAVCRNTHRSLLGNTLELFQSLRDGVELFMLLLLLGLALLVGRSNIKHVVANIQLEIRTRIDWLGTRRARCILDHIATGSSSDERFRGADILIIGPPRSRCPGVTAARRDVRWLHIVLALPARKRTVEEASLLRH
jgi:hypothetical protein